MVQSHLAWEELLCRPLDVRLQAKLLPIESQTVLIHGIAASLLTFGSLLLLLLLLIQLLLSLSKVITVLLRMKGKSVFTFSGRNAIVKH